MPLVKTDLKQSLLFLHLDRVQAKHHKFVHQPASLMELNRRKDAEKRYNNLMLSKHRMNTVQSALDLQISYPIKTTRLTRKMSAAGVPMMRRVSPVPGFKYHTNGEEKQTRQTVPGSDNLTRLVKKMLPDNWTLDRWQKSSAWIPEEFELRSSREPHPDTSSHQVSRQTRVHESRGGCQQPEDDQRSVVFKRRDRRASTSPSVLGALRRHRKSAERQGHGKRTVSFTTYPRSAGRESDTQSTGDVARPGSERRGRGQRLTRTTWRDGSSGRLSSHSEPSYQADRSISDKSFSRRSPSLKTMSLPELDDAREAEVRRGHRTKQKVRHFLSDVKNHVLRSSADFDLDQLGILPKVRNRNPVDIKQPKAILHWIA